MTFRTALKKPSACAAYNEPRDFKSTEAGMIPADWHASSLGEIFHVTAGGDLDKPNFSRVADTNFPFPIFANALTNSGLYGYSRRYRHNRDAITITARGDVGHAVYRGAAFTAIGRLLVLQKKTEIDARLIAEFINQRVSFSLESTGVPQLTAPQVSKYFVAYPPTLTEQQAIAESLSDADTLIEGLESLVAKKHAIKQGAMQELLTGQRRLPGFKGEWKERLLPDVCQFRGGKAHEQFISDVGRYVCVNSKFISTDGAVRKFSTANFCPAKRGDILMVMSDLPNGKALAKTFIADVDNLYAVNQRVCALTPYTDNSQFIAYILNRNPYFLKFDDGVSQTHLLNPVFQKCLVALPPSISEQQAIAAVLSDMDSEIEVLEAKLAKARQIKLGMMQELLTGRIRLV